MKSQPNHAYVCELCEQSDPDEQLQRIELVADDGESRSMLLCEGCIDSLEYEVPEPSEVKDGS